MEMSDFMDYIYISKDIYGFIYRFNRYEMIFFYVVHRFENAFDARQTHKISFAFSVKQRRDQI